MHSRNPSLVNADDREWKINQLLFVDDMNLIADSEENCVRLWKNLDDYVGGI